MKYLLNITFYAGSNNPEDIDNDLYLLETNRKMSYEEIVQVISKANKECSSITEDDELNNCEFFGLNNYEIFGLNLDTLMKDVRRCLPESKIQLILSNYGYIGDIDNYYTIEQCY